MGDYDVEDDDPKLKAPFKVAKHFQPTHQLRVNPHYKAMVLLRSPSWVRYDMGCQMWGIESTEMFEQAWEPVPETHPANSNSMLRMFRSKPEKPSSGLGDNPMLRMFGSGEKP